MTKNQVIREVLTEIGWSKERIDAGEERAALIVGDIGNDEVADIELAKANYRHFIELAKDNPLLAKCVIADFQAQKAKLN